MTTHELAKILLAESAASILISVDVSGPDHEERGTTEDRVFGCDVREVMFHRKASGEAFEAVLLTDQEQ